MTVYAIFDIITTTATSQMYGVVLWNPVTLLEYAQTVSYTPACRAATFFASLGMFFDQVMLNLTQNSIPAGMDVSGAFPKYFTTRRASLCLIIITAVIQPWRFLSQASIFLTILSSISSMSSLLCYLLEITCPNMCRLQSTSLPDQPLSSLIIG